MVWGGFCRNGMLPLAFPSTRMNSAEYISVLENNLIPYLSQNSDQEFIFQQDNASVHSSRETRAWLQRIKIQ